MNIDYRVREARRDDCDVIARMINDASEDAVNYLLKDLSSSKSPLTLLSEQLKTEVHYSYANTLIVEKQENTPVAMALSFPASGLMLDDALLQVYSPGRRQYLKYFSDNRINDSWHLDAIFVDKASRNIGLGRMLLAEIKQRARYYKFPAVQVFVFGTNKAAQKFYQSNEFSIDKRIQVDSHEFLQDKGQLLRMRCEL